MRPWSRAATIEENAPVISSGSRTSAGWMVMPSVRPAACSRRTSCREPGLATLQRTPTREIAGLSSLSNSNLFAASSSIKMVSPVTFPPGRPKLATSPDPTGSPGAIMTMGIVLVACLHRRGCGASTPQPGHRPGTGTAGRCQGGGSSSGVQLQLNGILWPSTCRSAEGVGGAPALYSPRQDQG